MKNDLVAFRRLAPAQRLDALRGERADRVFRVDRAAGIDEKARTAWLSIASEEPYERWWGVEVLDCKTGSIRDKRLRMGAPLLVGHDAADQVGVVESFEITSGRKLRILARFGKSQRAEEIWRDVLDGIRCNASVGYIIHDLILEKEEDGVATYRVTDWEPLEGSLVAVPADPTVGVARSATLYRQGKTAMDPKDLPSSGSVEEERQRVNDLIAAGKQYRDHGGDRLALELIADPNGNLEAFKTRMLAKMATKKPSPSAEPFESPYAFGDGARHVLSSGRRRAFLGDEGERNAYAFGMFLAAQLPGNERAARWCRENGIHHERYLTGTSDTAGGYLVPHELASELIKNMDVYGVARREARVWPMSSDALSVGKRDSGVTAYFTAEDAETTASDPSYGSVNLIAKEVMAVTKVARALMDDALVDVGDEVAFEITEAFAKLEDDCLFIGDATSTYGGMTGFKDALLAGSKHTAAANHDTTAEIDNTDLTDLMAKLPQYADPGAKWFMSKAFYGSICLRLLAIAGGNTVRALEAGAMTNPQFLGYPVVLSPNLPSDTAADYSSTIMLYFGNLRRASAFGDRQKISIMVDPYTLAGKAQIKIIGYERFHIINHGVGTASAAGPIVALVGQ